jgi:hypothetical protein
MLQVGTFTFSKPIKRIFPQEQNRQFPVMILYPSPASSLLNHQLPFFNTLTIGPYIIHVKSWCQIFNSYP